MNTNQFRSLREAAFSVTTNKKQPKVAPLQESVQQVNSDENENLNEFVDFVSELIETAETQLKTELTSEEISEVTDFVLAKMGTDMIIENIENEVGFELNENEIEYVINTLNESV
jgi:hypothetical protein